MKKNKISIEIHSLLKDIIKNIWVVVLCALIGVMGLYIATHAAYKPAYTSTATLSVISGNSATTSYSEYNIATEQANVLVNIFTEPTIKDYAAEYLGVDRFEGSVSAYVVEQTNFIELQVTSDHPEKSYNLLNAIIKSHHKVSNKIFSTANLTVIKMPTVPTGPSNVHLTSDYSLAVSGAVTIAFAVIIVFSLMRNTIKKEKDFDEKIDSKLIGTIVHESKRKSWSDIKNKSKKGLLIHNNVYMSLRFTESFHKIAAKLEHKKNNSGGKAFAITSVSENEGKSTCAANIAVSLAARGNKVLLIDLDFKKPALYKIFSEESLEDLDPNESLSRETEFTDFSFRKLKKTNLSLALVTKANPLNKKLISDSGVSVLINKIRPEYDFIIVDTAPMAADSSVTDIINMVDETILVIRTDTVNVNVLNDSIATISKISSNLAGCILNDVYMSSIPFSITGDDESSGYGRYGYGRYSYYGHYGRNTIPKNSDQNKVKE
ncbi:MAG: AAA family ATPase [Clostridia bacterium]|nr:AAA family ATPase [Clostridia bacterium]